MPVQWRGPAADAAAQRLASWQAQKRRRASPLALGALLQVLLPWLIFVLTTCLFLYSYEDLPGVVWLLVSLCAMLSLVMVGVGSVTQPGTLMALGVWCSASVGLAVMLGLALHRALGPYRGLAQGLAAEGVDPVHAPSGLAANATVLVFADGAFVDDRRTIGYIENGHIYCVAPVARHGVPSHSIIYWAVGVDCCEPRRDFDCGTAREPGAYTAVSISSNEDGQFRRAISQAALLYGTGDSSLVAKYATAVQEPEQQQPPPPVLVRFVGAAGEAETALWAEVRNLALMAFVMHLLWTALLATAADRLRGEGSPLPLDAAPQVPGTAGALSGQPSSPQMRPPTGGAQWPDPLLRGGGASPLRRWASPASATGAVEAATADLDPEEAFVKQQATPYFFEDVTIAQDGGFSEIEEFFKNAGAIGFIRAAVIPVAIIFNVYQILKTDLRYLRFGNQSLNGMYLISTDVLIFPVLNMLERMTHHTEPLQLRAQSVLAFLEISGIMLNILWTLWCALRLSWLPSSKKWRSVYLIYWEMLPNLATYSAMNFLGPVHPTALLMDFDVEVAREDEGAQMSRAEALRVFRFVVLRALYAIIGFDAFLVKFRISAHYIIEENISLGAVLGAGSFVLQLVGVLKMGTLMHRRLFIFMFAGEDCVLSAMDERRMELYNSLLAWKIFQSTRSWIHFSVVMLNFSDYDFQKLVLNSKKNASVEAVAASGAKPQLPWNPWGSGSASGRAPAPAAGAPAQA